jgi:hypothetical protein
MNLWSITKNIVLWSYERGSWQWSLLCLVILAFIFLTPGSLFDHRLAAASQEQVNLHTERTYVPLTEVNAVAGAHTNVRDLLAEVVSHRYQKKLSVKRFEPDTDSDGNIRGYRVWMAKEN